jgi:hypothetical protein
MIALGGEIRASPPPKETLQFSKVAERHPELRDELRRLLAAFPIEAVAALAKALLASIGDRSAGQQPTRPPHEAELAAALWGARIALAAKRLPRGRRNHAVRTLMAEAIGEVAPLLAPSPRQRARAHELVSHFASNPPPTTELTAKQAAALRRTFLKKARKSTD